VPQPDAFASGMAADTAGARQRETRRAGLLRAKSFGLRLGRTPGTAVAKALDLDPEQTGRALPASQERL